MCPCVCQQKCDKTKVKPSMQPYRDGKKYCAVCKFFQDSNIKNKCYCCNGKLRTKTRSSAPENRKMKFVE